ncbi:MAG: AAA family ATPase [Phycisphaerales bacterium]|jgi:predicted ABC-type ATPase
MLDRNIFVIGGPNGAGKSTVAPHVLHRTLNIEDFVNADVIASGLSGFRPEAAAMQAGRVMLARLRELAAANAPFAFESTLASRTFAPWLQGLAAEGWKIHILYVWVGSPGICLARIKQRVRKGGHHVPDDVVRRRYQRSLSNFFTLYRPLAHQWQIYDNSSQPAELVAWGASTQAVAIHKPNTYSAMESRA